MYRNQIRVLLIVFVAAALVFSCLSDTAKADLVEMTFSGYCNELTVRNTLDNRYNVGDTIIGKIRYDTDSNYDTDGSSSNYSGWSNRARSANAINLFYIKIMRDDIILDDKDLLPEYSIDQSTYFASWNMYKPSPVFNELGENFYFRCANYDYLQYGGEPCPHWLKTAKIYLDYQNVIPEDDFITPFLPSYYLEPVKEYNNKGFRLHLDYWLYTGDVSANRNYEFVIDSYNVKVVPEPASMLLLVVGGGIFALRKRS